MRIARALDLDIAPLLQGTWGIGHELGLAAPLGGLADGAGPFPNPVICEGKRDTDEAGKAGKAWASRTGDVNGHALHQLHAGIGLRATPHRTNIVLMERRILEGRLFGEEGHHLLRLTGLRLDRPVLTSRNTALAAQTPMKKT